MGERVGADQSGNENDDNDPMHLLSPTEVNSANGYNYNGEILKIAAASATKNKVQFVILTTEGLYAWGAEGRLDS